MNKRSILWIATVLLSLSVLALSIPASATTWYACGSPNANIDATNQWNNSSACTGTYLTWGSQGRNDTFDINGNSHFPVMLDVDPSPTPTTLTGTVSFTHYSTAVTGSGTSFTSQVSANDWIYMTGAPPAQVASVTDNTHLVLSTSCPGCANGYTGATASGTVYDGIVTLTGTVTYGSGPDYEFSSTATSVIHANINGAGCQVSGQLYITYGVTNLTVYGYVLGSTNGEAAVIDTRSSASTTVTWNGNIVGGSTSNSWGYNDTASVGVGNTTYLVVNGDVVGGTGGGSDGIYSNSTGYSTVTINGNAWAGGTAPSDQSYGFFNGQSDNAIINGYCIGSNTVEGANGCYFGAGGTVGDVITGGIINGTYALGVYLGNAYLYVQPGAGAAYNPSGAGTSYELWGADSSYTLGVADSHATEFPMNPGVANVNSGVNYGTFTGTYVCSGGSGMAATSGRVKTSGLVVFP